MLSPLPKLSYRTPPNLPGPDPPRPRRNSHEQCPSHHTLTIPSPPAPERTHPAGQARASPHPSPCARVFVPQLGCKITLAGKGADICFLDNLWAE